MKRAGLAQTWLHLDSDLAKLGLEPFHVGLTATQKLRYTAGLILLWALVLILLDPIAAFLILACGLWVTWNRNNSITRLERKIFITVLDASLLLAFLERFSVLFQAAGVLALLVLAHIVYVWRR